MDEHMVHQFSSENAHLVGLLFNPLQIVGYDPLLPRSHIANTVTISTASTNLQLGLLFSVFSKTCAQ